MGSDTLRMRPDVLAWVVEASCPLETS